MKYLVVIKWVDRNIPMEIIGYAETREEAQEYIDKKNEGYVMSGLGYDEILEVGKVELKEV